MLLLKVKIRLFCYYLEVLIQSLKDYLFLCKSNRMSVFLCELKDLTNRWTDMIFLYFLAFYRFWELLWGTGGYHHTLSSEIVPNFLFNLGNREHQLRVSRIWMALVQACSYNYLNWWLFVEFCVLSIV